MLSYGSSRMPRAPLLGGRRSSSASCQDSDLGRKGEKMCLFSMMGPCDSHDIRPCAACWERRQHSMGGALDVPRRSMGTQEKA